MGVTSFIVNIVITAIAVGITAYVLPGVAVTGAGAAILVALVLAIINAFLRPLIEFITLPINVLTIGLFTFVINALIIILVSKLVPGFRVDGFWWALLFSLILSIVNGLLFMVAR